MKADARGHHHENGCCDRDHHAHEEKVTVYSQEALVPMRAACRLAAQVLDYITPHVVAGVTTEELDRLCHDYILTHNAVPAPLGYHGYPKSICTSVNHVVCHGIPGPKKLVNGDILNIDVSVILDGWYGDTGRMFCVGSIPLRAQKLVDVTYEAMMRGIDQVKPGAHLGDIGHAIQSFVESRGFSVVRDFCGHGIGQKFHMPPNILHFGKSGTGLELQEGMFFTIEPMINAGRHHVKILSDGWTAVTCDRSLSAQFEHTVTVTSNGFEVLTL